jgi:hypothetical protein
MADLINVGQFPNDVTGDPARPAFQKINGLAAGTIPFTNLLAGPPTNGAPALTVIPQSPAVNDALLVGGVPVSGAISVSIRNTSPLSGDTSFFSVIANATQGNFFATNAAQATPFLTGGPIGAQVGLRNVGSYPLVFGTNNIYRGQIDPNGAWVVAPPTSGIALTVNGIATAGLSNGLEVFAGTNASDFALAIINQANTVQFLVVRGTGGIITNGQTDKGTGTLNAGGLFVNGGSVLAANGAGNFTIAAPSSGTALTVNGPSSGGAVSLVVNNSAGVPCATFSGLNASIQIATTGTPQNWAWQTVDAGGVFRLLNNTASTVAFSVTTAGNFAITAPSSGTALSVNGSGGATALLVSAAANQNIAAFDSTNASGGYIVINNSGTNYAFFGSAASLSSGSVNDATLRAQSQLILASGGPTARMTIGTTGSVAINAPTSGVALTVNAVSGSRALQLVGAGAGIAVAVTGGTTLALYLDNNVQGVGTPAFRIDASATTGAATPTGLGTVKPGAATAASSWLPISINGTTMYIPLWL